MEFVPVQFRLHDLSSDCEAISLPFSSVPQRPIQDKEVLKGHKKNRAKVNTSKARGEERKKQK